jgi:hypothetical protein
MLAANNARENTIKPCPAGQSLQPDRSFTTGHPFSTEPTDEMSGATAKPSYYTKAQHN